MNKRGRLMSRKGQFFIIAAVIISAVLIGLVVTKNYVRVSREPAKFYDLSEEIKAESNEVIDYGVVSNSNQLPNFTQKIAENMKDIDPQMQFVFIYGNESELVVENYGVEPATVNGQTVEGGGAETESNIGICIGTDCLSKTVTQERKIFKADYLKTLSATSNQVVVDVAGQEYIFDIAGGQQFYMIAMRKVEGGQYVEVK